MRATAVIGANFGDEGKGLMTDYFSVMFLVTLVVVPLLEPLLFLANTLFAILCSGKKNLKLFQILG